MHSQNVKVINYNDEALQLICLTSANSHSKKDKIIYFGRVTICSQAQSLRLYVVIL